MKRQILLKNKLAQFRNNFGITQTELAEAVGVTKNTISSIETGVFSPTALLAYKFCIFFGCTFEDLFYLEFLKDDL